MEQKKFYYVYQITNLVNGRIYIGMHGTNNMEDGYMGSGKLIQRAIQKYGSENFEKTILFEGSSLEDIATKEAEIVTADFLAREDVYNLTEGGRGGSFTAGSRGGRNTWDRQAGVFSPEGQKQTAERLKQWALDHPDQIAAKMKRMAEAALDKEARLKKQSTYAAIGHQKGSRNSQFGTKWIHRGLENKKIARDAPIPEGWLPGRKLKE